MLIVEEYEKAERSNELLGFVDKILSTKVKNNACFVGTLLFDGHEKLRNFKWYPRFLFKLGYAQALQDVQNEEAARKRAARKSKDERAG